MAGLAKGIARSGSLQRAVPNAIGA